MGKVIHTSESRGFADHGWLKSRHTFSFAEYYDPQRISFGALRVLNDDIVEGGAGFGTHPHRNMEIISIPLSGSLSHKDSEGHAQIIRKGEVQVMSAGTGIAHSEFNPSANEDVNFLQIWILPKKMNIEPRYEQRAFAPQERRNQFQEIVSPEKGNGTLWINQDARLSLADLDAGASLTYQRLTDRHGVYFFVIDGAIEVDGQKLGHRDALGSDDQRTFQLKALSRSEILAIEVPMSPEPEL